jgi:hypothetical protein
MLRSNEKLAYEENRKNFEIILDHTSNWIDPVRALIDAYPLEEWGLVGYRFGVSFADMLLAVIEIVRGVYFSAVRTLRSLIESMIDAAYVDYRCSRLPEIINEAITRRISCKEFDAYVRQRLSEVHSLTETKILFPTGFKIATVNKLSFLNKKEKSQFRRTYSELSKIVHHTPLRRLPAARRQMSTSRLADLSVTVPRQHTQR